MKMWFHYIVIGFIMHLSGQEIQKVEGISSYGLSFQEDGYMNDNSVNVYAQAKMKFSDLTTFSICTWVKFTYERIYNQLWSYCSEVETSDGEKDLVCSSLSIEPGVFKLKIAEFGGAMNISDLFKQFRWNLVCGSYLTQGESRLVTSLYFNGKKLVTELKDTPKGRNQWYSDGQWILGQDQDTLGGSFEKQQSLSGILSNINIWSRILTDDEVERMSNCFDSPMGDIFDWNKEEKNWKLSNVAKVDLDTSDFCIDFPDKNYYMLPERRSLESGQFACEIMGGSVSFPLDKAENNAISKIGDDFYQTCEANEQSGKTLWIGIERDQLTDKWVDVKDKERISYSNFRDGHGRGSTNCVFMLTRSGANTGRWGSAQCSDQSPRRVCTVCEFDTKKTKFSLRGLCQDSRHDRVYILEKDGQLKPFFKGLSTTIIRWNTTKLHWHLDHLRYKTQGFFYDETKKEYPIGRRQWLLDDRKCDLNDDLTWLTLTSCSQSEYTCTDGTCIPLEYRCDLKADCIDRSDEEDCRKVIFPGDYEKDLAPKHTVNGQRVDDALPVYLSVDILSFDKIDTKDMMIGVMMRINVTWRDRRVEYLNLRDDIYQNLVPDDELENIWIPEVGFYNAKTGRLDKDEHFALMVRRDSPPEPFDTSRSREDYVYEGYKNSLMYLRRISAEYHCTFNLRFFPFDTQTCKMEFKARTVTRNYLQLLPGQLRYKGPKVLVEFVVSNITMGEGRTTVTRSEIRIVINMARQYEYHLSQSYFQSFLMGFLAYLTFFVDISDFSDRFMGSLTALLVLASLMSTLTSQLPKTSYFKIIDYWLLFFLISTSLNIAVHVLVDSFYQREKKRELVKSGVNNWMEKAHIKPVEALSSFEKNAGEKKDNSPGAIALKATEGLLDDIAIKNQSMSSKIKMMTKGWTAQGINDFQKTLFPCVLLVFVFFYVLAAHFKWGDIDTSEASD